MNCQVKRNVVNALLEVTGSYFKQECFKLPNKIFTRMIHSYERRLAPFKRHLQMWRSSYYVVHSSRKRNCLLSSEIRYLNLKICRL